MLTLPIRLVRPATPRAQIVQLDLGDYAFAFTAGQAVLVANHGAEPRRPFSICCAPEDTRRDRAIELLVGIEPNDAGGQFTSELHQLVDVEGPVGSFTFPTAPEEDRFLFIAGGTGIAPLRAMLRHALTIPNRGIGLLYSVRTPQEFAYEHELRALAAAKQIDLMQTVTRWTGDWAGARGRIDRKGLAALVRDAATLCFVCGPAALVEDVPKLLEEIGVVRSRIRVEERA